MLIAVSIFSHRKIDFKINFFRVKPEEDEEMVAQMDQMNLNSNLLCARKLLEEEDLIFQLTSYSITPSCGVLNFQVGFYSSPYSDR